MKFYKRKVKKYARGDMVFSENNAGDGMYIVDKGKVRVFKTVSAGAGTQEIELCTLGPKAIFGEMSMIDEEKRSASVQAVEPTECTIITKQIFEDHLSRIPPWMVNMIRILVKRLRDTNDKLREAIETDKKPPNDDTGSVLMVQGDKNGAPDGQAPSPSAAGAGVAPLDPRRISSEEIIKDLFRKDAPPKQ